MENSLSISKPFTILDFAQHSWLKLSRNDLKEPASFEPNEYVRMLSNIDHKHLSKALAAI